MLKDVTHDNLVNRASEIAAILHPHCDCFSSQMSKPFLTQVKAARQQASILQKVIDAFKEELASRQTKAAPHRFESWNEGGVSWLGPLME